MKKLLFFLIAFLNFVLVANSQCTPRLFYNSLNVSIDFQNGILDVEGIGCEPCLFEYITDAAICESRIECLEDCTNEDYENCYLDCENEFGYAEIAYCKSECDDYYGYNGYYDYENCFRECEDMPEKIRTAVQWDIQVNIWYNNGFTEDFSGQPTVIAGTNINLGINIKNKERVNLNHTFTNFSSYCYIVQTTIVYDDGTCCRFLDYKCFQAG